MKVKKKKLTIEDRLRLVLTRRRRRIRDLERELWGTNRLVYLLAEDIERLSEDRRCSKSRALELYYLEKLKKLEREKYMHLTGRSYKGE